MVPLRILAFRFRHGDGEVSLGSSLQKVEDKALVNGQADGEGALSVPRPRAVGMFLRWMQRKGATPWGKDPRDYRPEAIKDMFARFGRFFGDGCYFEMDHRGFENVPADPVMVVSNHSGGTTILDVLGLLEGWYRKFGVHRPLHPMAHEILLSNRLLGSFLAQRGILHANEAIARNALVTHRRDILVLPGGDRDAWRPYSKRYEVCFAGRTGYARLALKTGVPVIPVAHAGAHETLIVLTDGRWFARKIRLHKLARAEIFPIHLSLPFGLTIGPWPHFPVPARLRYRVGPPVLPPEGARPGEEPDVEQVREFDRRVQAAVQGLLDALRDESRGPLAKTLKPAKGGRAGPPDSPAQG